MICCLRMEATQPQAKNIGQEEWIVLNLALEGERK